MKTGGALLLSTFLAALCGSLVNGNGVCYDPDHALGAKSEASIIKDMQSIRQKGFTHVRTYISKFGNTEMAKIIRDQGMTLALGVPYGNPDYATQLESAIAVANGGNVQYLFIGNENLRGSVPPAFIQEIRNVKKRVPGSVKVGTVQRNTEILENISGLGELIAACDAIGINIHPFFTPGQNGATNAIELTKTHWNKALAVAGDKLILTETGWPTQGSFAGNQGSTAAASGYFSAYNAWNAIPGDKRFYFQMFDQPTRAEDFEQAYGIFTKDNVDKFNVAMKPAPTSAPAPVYQSPVPTAAPAATQTTVPTATPAAAPGVTPTATPGTTPAPTPMAATPTPTPSLSNSTTQTGGSSASSMSHDVTHSSGSKGFGIDTGIDGSHSASSGTSGTSTTGGSDATQAGGAAATAAPEIVSNGHGDPVIAGESDKAKYAGGSSTETNSKSAVEGGATTVVFAVAAGCVAVVAAFGFIYHTRKKAAELEAAEAKESVAITPHNSCVL